MLTGEGQMEHRTEQVDAINAKDAGAIKKMLELQAADAADRLRACPHFCKRLASSRRLNTSLGGQVPREPSAMVRLLMDLDRERYETLQKVMRQIRKEFNEAAQEESDPEARNRMEQATVALYLLCMCRLIEVESPSRLSGIPSLESDEAVNLFAILIAAVMAGGKLVLLIDQERKTLVPKHAYAVQWLGVPEIESAPTYGAGLSIAPRDHFELGLYQAVMRDEVMPDDCLDVEPLSPQQRADLIERLLTEREDDDDRNTMCVVSFGPESPPDIATEILRPLGIPAFSDLHPDIAYTLLGGLSAEHFIAQLKELLRTLRSVADTASRGREGQYQDPRAFFIKKLRQEFNELRENSPGDPRVAQIEKLLDALENPGHGSDRQEREDGDPQGGDVLTRFSGMMDKLRSVADSGEKLIPAVIRVFESS